METEVLKKTKKTVAKMVANEVQKSKKTLLDYAKEFKERPLIKVLDEDLVYGSNMWPKLMKEEVL